MLLNMRTVKKIVMASSFIFGLYGHSLFAKEVEIVGDASKWRNLVPAKQLESQASMQYQQMMSQARSQQALAADNHPKLLRLRRIANKITPYVAKWNPAAPQWKWEVNLVGSNQINAFCMPGGKIAFYTGIIDQLQLTDDEVAIIMGHEIAHALREHARAQMGKRIATKTGAAVATELLARSLRLGNTGQMATQALGNLGAQVLTLKFSRDDETDADLVGLDLAARGGFDPRAAVVLWQKMQAQQKKAPPPWLSTHPTNTNRIDTISKNLAHVLPLYAQTQQLSVSQLKPYRSNWETIASVK